MYVSHKNISWNSYPFKRTCLSFKVEFLQGKGTLFSLLTIIWHILNKVFTFLSNTCVLRTKSFFKFLPFQKNVIIFKCKASTDKRKTVLTSNYSLTYPKQLLLISEKEMSVSLKSVSWNSYHFKRMWLSLKVRLL